MGPVDMAPGIPRSVDVRPHPHIGLSTITYLFDGEIMHRDSLATEQAIRPGEVNWMTAGRGITHSERFERERAEGGHMRSEEHTSELQSLMRISYAVFSVKKKILKYEQREVTNTK